LRDGRTKAKLPIILTVAYFYEQVRRADGGMGGWGDGGFKKYFTVFALDQGKSF